MSAGLILFLVIGVPYVALNVWRLAHGRSWAFSFCHVMKEWEQGERERIAAARAARRPPSAHAG